MYGMKSKDPREPFGNSIFIVTISEKKFNHHEAILFQIFVF
jgi:hypothetical protein